MKTSPSKEKRASEFDPSFNDLTQQDLTETLTEAKFIRSNMTSQNHEFYKNMKQFSRKLSARRKFIHNMRGSIKKPSYDEIGAKCSTVSEITFRNLPFLSPKIVDYAIEMNILKEDDLKGLIINPNKYSIFFEKQELGSPFTRKALKNLDFKPELVKFPNFSEFTDPNVAKINQIVSYLIDLNKKYERFKLVLKERNRLRDLNRDIRRKFPYYKNLSMDNTMKSIESLNETLTQPQEMKQKLKLYLNHSMTYSFEEKKKKNQEKLENLKSNMINYIKGQTIQRFDGEEFLGNKQEKHKKVIKKKKEHLNVLKKKAQECLEPVMRKVEDRKHTRSASALDEEYKERMKELELREKKETERLEKEHEKLLKRLEDFATKRENYKSDVVKSRVEIKNREERKIEAKVEALDAKQHFLEKMKEENISLVLKKKSIHESKLEDIRKKALENDKKEEERKIQKFLDQFKRKYEESYKKRTESLQKRLAEHKIQEREAFENVKNNRERMKERLRNKEEYFRKKLKNDGEKIKRAETIRDFIRRKTIVDEFDKLQKLQENKEEQDGIRNQKKETVLMKEQERKKKVAYSRKENDFVIEERRDYNTKLIKYRDNLMGKIKV